MRSKSKPSRLKKLCPHPLQRRNILPVFDALRPDIQVGERVEKICMVCNRVLRVSLR